MSNEIFEILEFINVYIKKRVSHSVFCVDRGILLIQALYLYFSVTQPDFFLSLF